MKCSICDGHGEGHLWKDLDPIEGSKMAPVYPCLFCDGDGKVGDDSYKAAGLVAFNAAIEEMRQRERSERLRKTMERNKLVDSVKAKLTKEELNALVESLIQ